MGREYTRIIDNSSHPIGEKTLGYWNWDTRLDLNITGSGTGWGGARDTATVYRGDGSLRLYTGTAAGDYVIAYERVVLPPSQKVLLDARFRGSVESDVYGICIEMASEYAPDALSFAIEYRPYERKWYLRRSNGSEWLYLSDLIAPYALAWSHVKLAGDFQTERYLWAVVNKVTLDLSNYKAYKATTSAGALLAVNLKVSTVGGVSASAYFDEVYLREI